MQNQSAEVVARDPKTYVLGLDLGVSSVGWAAIELKTDTDGEPLRNHPTSILGMGVRRFDAGVSGTQEDIRRGKDQSHATDRRVARSARRLLWRRKRRKQRVFELLVEQGLLPQATGDCPTERTTTLQALDLELHAAHVSEGDRRESHVVPYTLRAKALYHALTPHELGRALYHLAQRRGFLSNRKSPQRESEDDGVVKEAISALQQDIVDSGCATLGEYLGKIDPEGERRSDASPRIRGRWTSRKMYVDEFHEICRRQKEFHSCLRDEKFTAKLFDAIFGQRPLRSQTSLIGTCDLIPGRRRAAVACIPFQRFRLLQKLNDLSYIDHDGEIKRPNTEQRKALLEKLIREGDLTWSSVSKILGLKRKNKETNLPLFSHESGGEKKLIGDRTTSRLVKILGEEFEGLNNDQLIELVDEIRSYANEEMLSRRLRNHWNLSEHQAAELAAVRFEPGYGSLSRKAISLLIPKMLEGISFATAQKSTPELESDTTIASLPLLPPQGDGANLWANKADQDQTIYRSFSNPAVSRTLSELRKVVNALIRKHGKPSFIRVELARDLKNSRSRRADLTKRRNRNQAMRARAKEAIEKERGNTNPSRSDIEKWLLAEECGFICPYSGKVIPRNKVLTAEFEIEHIIPFSLSFDNSFANKTLSHRDWNRDKGNRTPLEAFSTRQDWDSILQRVKRFSGPYARRKLDLFQRAQPTEAEFLERQLTETRYIARQAVDYLSTLYGGSIETRTDDEPGTRRVSVTPGRATSLLRNGWQLHSITGGSKDRKDHRHHAIDALIVALTQDRFLQEVSFAAAQANSRRLERLTTEIDLPWETFLEETREHYETINVSCRPNRKLNGRLHKETIFSRPLKSRHKNDKPEFFAVRRPLEMISNTEINQIVDDRIREIVTQHLSAHKNDLKAAFADPNNHPYLTSKNGRIIPIHRVRVRRREKPKKIGKGVSARYVVPGANYRLDIIAKLDDEGQDRKWISRIVNRLDAKTEYSQWKHHGANDDTSPNPLNSPPIEEDERFVFSLMAGDHLMIDLGEDEPALCRVNNISESEIELQRHNDARSATELRKIPGGRIRRRPENLRSDNAKKVEVSPLGEIIPASR